MSETAPDVEPWRRRLREVMTSHSQLVRELLLEGGGIERKAGPPSPLTFMRNHVAKSLPVLYTGAVDHWPALRRWDHSYLRRQAGKLQVHVALTPDGFADAVVTNRKGERVFAKPCETSMAFENFLDAIAQPRVDETGRRRRPVLYVSHQNSSLVAEFEPLWPDVGLELPWATEAFGAAPQENQSSLLIYALSSYKARYLSAFECDVTIT
uniref:Cupin-like domain-containing protein n=1 Tax=Chrysotila carterae TaxID=13221 RepID=A0A7S4BGJ1_CHRCT|mmetsp:Transcript_17897/g.34901  ORF Transcript_17897/g.34901 Transcript_17897/m.34901 type:complete len:210 (-) Transcript_17897:202-831(-)